MGSKGGLWKYNNARDVGDEGMTGLGDSEVDVLYKKLKEGEVAYQVVILV